MPVKGLDWSDFKVIAGPCAAESEQQVVELAESIKKNGGDVLRAGLWKPRTSPNSWQGAGDEGVEWMKMAKKSTKLAIATEVKDSHSLRLALKAKFDILWIGSRSAQYYPLLEEVGRLTADLNLPVILKRGMGSDLEEWLGSANYIKQHNPNVILCERGIKGFPKDTRNVLDLQTAKLAQLKSTLPVIIDVSHAAGRRDLIIPMALAVKAAGFNGLMVEVHSDPDKAKTDAKQQISIMEFSKLMRLLSLIPNNLNNN